jgi:hypothetical protein
MSTKFSNLKKGEVLSESQYYTVEKIQGDKVQLSTDQGESVVLDKGYVESLLTSAEQFSESENITKTDAAAKILSAAGVAMTINFNKQVKEADVTKEVMAAVTGASIKDIEKAVKAGVKKAIQGEERTIVGRHHGDVTDLGRINFIDMKLDRGNSNFDARLRQVDTRTVNWFILRGKKYTVK